MTRNNISAHNADADAGAAVAAQSLGMGNALYKDIPSGGLFRFKASPPGERLEKLSNGQYRIAGDKNAPRWRTGQRTAVFRIPTYDELRAALQDAVNTVDYLRPETFDDDEHESSFNSSLDEWRRLVLDSDPG